MNTAAHIVLTHPAGYESLATAIIEGLAAARRARPAEHVRSATQPKPNCHDAADAWTVAHAGTQPVRGWLAIEQDGAPLRLIAHSLVRNPDGTLLDPTFAHGEPVYPFVPHPRTIGGFFSLLCRPGAPYELLVSAADGEA
ncbi:MAG: hypothetical protein EPN70_03255 [Paraburkholderia sp.]|uniref:hypothetical protein n=1 Tax=Paraburkholderia sp. TaxID=1926495 RepID=UPI0011F594E8|nr:hypothetical protein [Paraburkholderia sp.]TAM07282.1 MAG: hypothetical protein EPN70_03255 [Paraburkholderia sp.]